MSIVVHLHCRWKLQQMERKIASRFNLFIAAVLLSLLSPAECKRLFHYYHQEQRTPKHSPEQPFTFSNHYYVIHHHFQEPWKIPRQFSIPGESTTDCEDNLSEILCIPNSYLICLSNGTLLCVTDMHDTVTCDFGKPRGVPFKESCEKNPLCGPDQTNLDVCMPCLSNVTLVIKKMFYESFSHQVQTMDRKQHLCLTVLANPRQLESSAGATVLLLGEMGRLFLNKMSPTTEEPDVEMVL